jgi:hypothetical protein
MIFTCVFIACIYSEKDKTNFYILLLLNWLPSTVFFSIHLYFTQEILGPILSKLYMVLLLVAQPASSTILQVNYFMRRIQFTGQAVETFKMKKFLQLAQSSVLMNNFTSMAILVFTLNMANNGQISNPTIISISATLASLHLIQLSRNIINQQTMEKTSCNVSIRIYITSFSIVSSLVLKTLPIVVLLSSRTAYSVPLACLIFLLALCVNWVLERKLCSSTDGSTWLRSAHSLIFPLAPRTPGRRAALGAALQLLVGNLAAVALGSTVALIEGVVHNIFITTNIVKATTAMSALLILHTTATYATVFILPAPSAHSLVENDIEDGDDESTESTPLISSQNGDEGNKRVRKAAWVLLLPTTLALILASPYPLLLHQFNTCPALPSDSNSHVTCPSTNSTPTVGTVCHLTCSPLHWSSSSLSTTCT